MSDLSRFSRRLNRVTGVTAHQLQSSGTHQILDFEFDWPSGMQPVEKSPRRQAAHERSAIIFNADGTVREFQLRFAPLPKAAHPDETAAEQRLTRLVNAQTDAVVSVMLADDGPDSWTPHIQPKTGTAAYTDPEPLVDDIVGMWQTYMAQVTSGDSGNL